MTLLLTFLTLRSDSRRVGELRAARPGGGALRGLLRRWRHVTQPFGLAVFVLAVWWVGCTPLWALDISVGPAGVAADSLVQPPISLSGLGVSVGVLDGWIDPTHPDLLVTGNGGVGPAQARATEVAGVIASGNPVYTGVAPAAFLYGYGLSDRTQAFEGANWLTRPEQGAGIVVYSRGWPLNGSALDGNSPETMHVDYLAQDRDVLFVVPGNQIPGGTPLPADAYNALTVNGTLLTSLPGYERYDQVASWNYYGEAPIDGRSKPDLLAPGGFDGPGERDPESIHTTTVGGGFADVSNTAMAAAHVAGTAALLTEYGRAAGLSTDHNVLKAVLINSADKYVWDTAGQGWNQSEASADPAVPLDNEMGAGQALALWAYYQYSAGEWEPGIVSTWGFDQNMLTDSTPRQTYHFGVPLAAGLPLTATLTWDRRVSLEDDQDGDGEYDFGQTDRLVGHELNNLDINLIDQQGTVIAGSWSTVDNVEHLYWNVPEDGVYYLSVELTEARDLPWQSYALAWIAFPTDVDSLDWEGGEAEWGSANWNDGTVVRSPAGGEPTLVSSGRVTVEAPYVGAAGPASLVLYGGEVAVTPTGELQAADAVSVFDEATLLVDGELTTSELFVWGDEHPEGAHGGTLAGDGTVTAHNVYVFGTFSPGVPEPAGLASVLAGSAQLETLAAPVPEPGSAWLLVAAGICVGVARLRRTYVCRR